MVVQAVNLPKPFYQDDLCTIYCGDSRELVPLISAEVMVTDPPYGYAYASNHGGKWKGQQIANDADTTCREIVLDAWGERPAIVFGSWKRERPAATRTVLIWDKDTGPGMGDLSLPWGNGWEEIYVLGGGYTGRRSSGVLRHQRAAPSNLEHPNEKPLPLMRELISKCPPGTIVDPFMGSGSTLRAAKDLGRRAIGIEVDERWCTVAAERLAQDVLFAGGEV